jgi:hypothetical protein
MVPLTALWLPILLSTVILFVASSIMHTLLPTTAVTIANSQMKTSS